MLLQQLRKFATTGLLNTLVGLSTIYLLMALGSHYAVANVAGYLVGLVISFVLNRYWTFNRRDAAVGKDAMRFVLLFLVAYSCNLALVAVAIEELLIPPAVAQLMGVVLYNVLNFVGMKFFVFSLKKA